jgi:hypothetical protein
MSNRMHSPNIKIPISLPEISSKEKLSNYSADNKSVTIP